LIRLLKQTGIKIFTDTNSSLCLSCVFLQNTKTHKGC